MFDLSPQQTIDVTYIANDLLELTKKKGITTEAPKLAFGMTKKSKRAVAQAVVHLRSFELRTARAPPLIIILPEHVKGLRDSKNN